MLNQPEISIRLAELNDETVHHFKETTRLFEGDSCGCVPIYQCPCCEKTYYHTHPSPVEFDRGYNLGALFDLAENWKIEININLITRSVHQPYIRAEAFPGGMLETIVVETKLKDYDSTKDAACAAVGNAMIKAKELRGIS